MCLGRTCTAQYSQLALKLASLAHAAASASPHCLTSTLKQRLPVCLHIPASAIAIVPQRCCSLVVGWRSTDVHLSSLQMFVNRAAQLLAESEEEWEASQPSWQDTEVGSCWVLMCNRSSVGDGSPCTGASHTSSPCRLQKPPVGLC